jgi:hypothetical protein
MYNTCPKCDHTRQPDETADRGTCPACGLVFAKWMKHRFHAVEPSAGGGGGTGRCWRRFPDALLLPPPDGGRLQWSGRLLLWLLLAWLGWLTLISHPEDMVSGNLAAPLQILHRIDLVFHEAGHVLFRPLGDFLMVLGGSLLQVLLPAVAAGAFLLRHHNPFGASVGLWWTGQNLADVAVYIGDARALRLPLLGGGSGADRPGMHDWHNILGRLGWLDHDRMLAGATDVLGVILMGAALVWGAVLLWRHHRSLH